MSPTPTLQETGLTVLRPIREDDFLAASNSDLTMKELKDILLEIGRNDLISLLITKGIAQN